MIILCCNNNFNGKYGAIFGSKLPGPPGIRSTDGQQCSHLPPQTVVTNSGTVSCGLLYSITTGLKETGHEYVSCLCRQSATKNLTPAPISDEATTIHFQEQLYPSLLNTVDKQRHMQAILRTSWKDPYIFISFLEMPTERTAFEKVQCRGKATRITRLQFVGDPPRPQHTNTHTHAHAHTHTSCFKNRCY
jgi:hypothetical protein